MAGYILVRSNWTSINSISLDLICDIDIEENNQSILTNKEDETNNDDMNSRKNENITKVILRSNEIDKREDPLIILSVLQPDEYHITSIQLLSNAKHIEFYHREYIGSCQGSRITELDNESIYETIFDFNQSHEELTLKCLKLADITDLIVYCLQISLYKIKEKSSSISMTNLPFDLNRVRSMIDETNLSSNAKQFMNDLQHIQEQRRIKDNSSQQFNLIQLMSMMKGMKTSSSNIKNVSPTPLTPLLNEIKSSLTEEVKSTCSQDNNKLKQELNALENRLQTLIDKRLLELQQHIDHRFDQLEEKLTNLNK